MCCQENRGDSHCCERPDHLLDRPQACTPEQIRKCHGEVKEHPCIPKGEQP